jgi:hypothetical protein
MSSECEEENWWITVRMAWSSAIGLGVGLVIGTWQFNTLHWPPCDIG